MEAPYHQLLQDPLVVNGIQYSLTWILLQTTPHGSWLRIANIGALIAWMVWVYLPENILLSGADYEENMLMRTLKGCVPVPLVLRTAAALVLLEDTGEQDTVTATRLTVDSRVIGTRWEVRGVPDFPAYYGTSRPRPPARGQFLLRQTAILVWECLCLDLVFSQFRAWTGQNSYPARPRDLPMEMLPPGEWASSGVSMLAIGILGYLGFDISYQLASIVCVWLGMSTGNFPPLFGSIWDAYSMKNWWGKSWHQFMRLPFTATSSAITRRVLCLPHSSVVGGYLNIALVFALSGVMHYLGALASNMPSSGALHFFGLSGLGLLIESTFQNFFYRFVVPNQAQAGKTSPTTPAWHKAVGCLWVGAWFSLLAPWYSPEWEYLFTMGSSSTSASFVGGFTNAVGVPGACAVVGVTGLLVKKWFKTSL